MKKSELRQMIREEILAERVDVNKAIKILKDNIKKFFPDKFPKAPSFGGTPRRLKIKTKGKWKTYRVIGLSKIKGHHVVSLKDWNRNTIEMVSVELIEEIKEIESTKLKRDHHGRPDKTIEKWKTIYKA